MSEFQQMIRNPAYDGSSEDNEKIDPVDITPLISSISVPIVTVPAEDNDGNERVEDKDEDEDEDENDAPPRLETDESSSIGDEGSATGEMHQIQDEWRPEDEGNHCGWEPPNNLLPQKYQFLNAEPEEILERMQYQLRFLIHIMEKKMNWPAACEPEDDQRMVEGLENIQVMEHKLYQIVLSLKGEIRRSHRTEISKLLSP